MSLLKTRPLLPKSPRPIMIIGAGGIVKDAHLPAYKMAGFSVHGITNRTRSTAEALAQDWQIPNVYDNIEEAVAKSPDNVVYDLTLPADKFVENLKKLPDGAAVLIQKPMGETFAEARKIHGVCHEKNLTAAINLQLRFAPFIIAAKDLIDRGVIGDLRDIEIRVTVETPWEYFPFLQNTNRLEIDYHSIHHLDCIRHFLGTPQGIYAKTLTFPELNMPESRTSLILDYGHEVRANIQTNHFHRYGSRHQESYIKYEGTRGAIKITMGLLMNYPEGLPDEFEYCTFNDVGDPEWTSCNVEGSWFPHAFVGSMAQVMRAADGETGALVTSVDDTLETMACVEAAYFSSDRGGVSPARYLPHLKAGAVKQLQGMTWNHSRGFVPLAATSQRFSELYPDVDIEWKKRSLQAFADQPIEDLAKIYDLIIVDHPHVGVVADSGNLLPLEELLDHEFLQDQKKNQVGQSHDSYFYAGHQWALATDAAAPVAAWRQDFNGNLPKSWKELLSMAANGNVAVPAIPIDSLMNTYMLCTDIDDTLFSNDQEFVNRKTGIKALEHLKQLVDLCPDKCLERNPIKTFEALVSEEDPAEYCPFAYGYSNYARSGYARQALDFGDIVDGPSNKPLRSVLGGTGLAVSRNCPHPEAAKAFLQYTVSPEVQKSIYAENGGQPGHRRAWTHKGANALCHDYFRKTLPALDRAYVRPRYNGYMHFQDYASLEVHKFLKRLQDVESTMDAMNEFYRQSISNG